MEIGPVDTEIALLILKKKEKKKKLTQAKYIALPASLPSGLKKVVNDYGLHSRPIFPCLYEAAVCQLFIKRYVIYVTNDCTHMPLAAGHVLCNADWRCHGRCSSLCCNLHVNTIFTLLKCRQHLPTPSSTTAFLHSTYYASVLVLPEYRSAIITRRPSSG